MGTVASLCIVSVVTFIDSSNWMSGTVLHVTESGSAGVRTLRDSVFSCMLFWKTSEDCWSVLGSETWLGVCTWKVGDENMPRRVIGESHFSWSLGVSSGQWETRLIWSTYTLKLEAFEEFAKGILIRQI